MSTEYTYTIYRDGHGCYGIRTEMKNRSVVTKFRRLFYERDLIVPSKQEDQPKDGQPKEETSD